MGFFASGTGAASTSQNRFAPKAETLHKMGCRACPLNGQKGLCHPDMPATGAKKPLVYMLGEAPGQQEDERGKQFVGPSGALLRGRIPDDWVDQIRWNNVVRTRPPKNRTPEFIEIESCRPSVVKDIEESKPVAIFGFGNIPLEWVSSFTGIYKWRGRRFPVKIGNYACWYYPMLHPAAVLRKRKYDMSPTKVGSEDERAFVFDLKRAFKEVEEGLPEPVVHTRKDAEADVEMVLSFDDKDVDYIIERLAWFRTQKAVGVDYETNRIRPYNNGSKILTIALAAKNYAFAFPLHHRKAKWTQEQKERLWKAWMEFLFATPVKKIVHNLAFEMEWSAVLGDKAVLRSSNWEDTMQQAVVLDERVGGKPGCLGLDFLVQQYFGFGLKALSKLDKANLDSEPLEVVLMYNAMDAKYHRGLYFKQRARLDEEGLWPSYQRALRRVPTCVLTQIKGVPRDPEACDKLNAKYEKRIERLQKEIAGLKSVGRWEAKYNKKYNPMSDDHAVLMFRDLLGYKEGYTNKVEVREEGFARKHKNESEGYSTDKEVLKSIGTRLALLTIELRESLKRKNTYVKPLLDGAKEVYDDGMLHPTLNTAFSEPGRTSSEGPNVQNYPKRDGEAKEVRKGIRAPDGMIFCALDQGQIQARIIGMASKDKAFCKSLWEKYDVHMEWAQRISKVYPRILDRYTDTPDPMKAFRGDVKNQWTFPLFFGAQIKSVAEYLHIPERVAEKIVTEFWNQFSGVADWHERLRKFYYANGYVELLTGRRVRAPLSFNEMINYPIQGTEAEIVLDCHSRISEMESNLWDRSLDRVDMPKRFTRLSNAGHLLFQPSLMIHDDLTFLLPKENYMDYVEYIVPEMLKKTFSFINVPLQVELSVGEVWYDMKEQEKFYSEQWFKPGEGGW